MIRALAILILVGLATLSAPIAQAKSEALTLAKKKIQLGRKTLTVEIADSNDKRAHGLMYREKLPEDGGMLFIFDNEETLAFWMKNTLIPLAIGYFDKNKTLVDIQEMEPAVAGEMNPKTYRSTKPAKYALEMPKGWYARNKIAIGTRFSFVP